jgi:hypothetical protein
VGPVIARFILTVEAGEQAPEVEATLREAADLLNAGLTRSDWEPADSPGYVRKVRHRRLRKRGRLS